MIITGHRLTPVRSRRRTGSISVHLIIEVTTDVGLIGLGEMSDLDCYRMTLPDLDALSVAIDRVMVGFDPTRHAALHQMLHAQMPSYLVAANSYPPFTLTSQLAAALDSACYDLAGKAAGIPVCDLLGGRSRDELEMAYPLFPATGDEGVAQRLASVEELLALGVDCFRYYVGVDRDADDALLDALRSRFGPRIQLKGLDFQGRFYWKDAVAHYDRLKQYGVDLVESVSWHEDYEGMAEVRRRVDAAVSEHVSSYAQAMRLIRANAIDVFNVVHHSGGLWGAQRLLGLADAAGLKALLGTTQELGIGTAAVAHLGASAAALHFTGDAVGPLLYLDDVVAQGVEYRGATLLVPQGPGLGVSLDPEALERQRGSLAEWDRPAHLAGYIGQ